MNETDVKKKNRRKTELSVENQENKVNNDK